MILLNVVEVWKVQTKLLLLKVNSVLKLEFWECKICSFFNFLQQSVITLTEFCLISGTLKCSIDFRFWKKIFSQSCDLSKFSLMLVPFKKMKPQEFFGFYVQDFRIFPCYLQLLTASTLPQLPKSQISNHY